MLTYMSRSPLFHPSQQAFPHSWFTIVTLETPITDRIQLWQGHFDERSTLATRQRSPVMPQYRCIRYRQVSQGSLGEERAEGEEDCAEDGIDDEVNRCEGAEEGCNRGENRFRETEGVRCEEDVGENVFVDESRSDI